MFYAPTLFQTTGFKNDALLLSAVSIGVILLTHLNTTGTMDKRLAAVVVVLVCLYVMCFAWSWGPLGWLIPSETFPLETRTSGFAFAVISNMLMTFLVAQVFLSMLCHMMKGVPIDSIVERVWKQHPVWKNFMDDHDPKSKEMA
ncbi:unnamed protein product [Camellia sinensis]